MEKVSQFVKLVVAVIKGDDAEATAIKIQRKGSAALRAQIAIKQAEMLNCEDKLESAIEVQQKARINNGKLITDSNEAYIGRLIEADNNVVDAQDAIETLNSEIAFLTKELGLISN